MDPDNFTGNQYCIQLWGSRALDWDDTECEAVKNIVCESERDSDNSHC